MHEATHIHRVQAKPVAAGLAGSTRQYHSEQNLDNSAAKPQQVRINPLILRHLCCKWIIYQNALVGVIILHIYRIKKKFTFT